MTDSSISDQDQNKSVNGLFQGILTGGLFFLEGKKISGENEAHRDFFVCVSQSVSEVKVNGQLLGLASLNFYHNILAWQWVNFIITSTPSSVQIHTLHCTANHLGRPGAPDVSPAPQTVSYLVPYKHLRYQSNVNGYVNQ